MTRLLLAVPSYRPGLPNRGISAHEAMALIDGESLIRAGLQVAPCVIPGVPLIDLARNDLLAIAHATRADYMLCQDDDTRTEPSTVREMVRLAQEGGLDVVSAPVQTRPGPPNVLLAGAPLATADGSLLAPVIRTGLASVLVSRRGIETILRACEGRHYRPQPLACETLAKFGAEPRSWNVFGSETVAATELEPAERVGYGDDECMFLGDDHVFSYRMRLAGVKLWAYLNAVTEHAGMGRFCYADGMEAGR